MSMGRSNATSEIVTCIFDAKPDPLIQYRLRRDVLKQPINKLFQLKSQLDSNPWVQQLTNEQHPDGSWGRFHSRDSAKKQKTITTEFGVNRGLALGMDASHPSFCRVIDHLTKLLSGCASFPDPPERNNRWPIGVQLFTAATLSQLKPNHPFLDEPWNLWKEIATRAFANGDYDLDADIQAHRELTGASVVDSYLLLNNKYALTLLSARAGDLPESLAVHILNWSWSHPQGIRYFGETATNLPIGVKPGVVDRWFYTQELLSRFPAWKDCSGDVIDWLWSEQGDDGLWDFGPRRQFSHYLPLSPNWRNPLHRKIDWSTRVLVLLSKLNKS